MVQNGGQATIRTATENDALDVRRLIDGALLDVPDDLADRIAAGDVLVSEVGDGRSGTVTGALVLDKSHVEAVAVRQQRRGNGIGRELVEAAAEQVDGTLSADFRPEIRPFYESLGFDIEECAEDSEDDGAGGENVGSGNDVGGEDAAGNADDERLRGTYDG